MEVFLKISAVIPILDEKLYRVTNYCHLSGSKTKNYQKYLFYRFVLEL